MSTESPTISVVYNACYGGFSLSHKAVLRLAELKGVQLWPQRDDRFHSDFYTYWTVPPEEWLKDLGDEWCSMSMEARQAHNAEWERRTVDWQRGISRTDPHLVQVVRELGEEANGKCARLEIAEIAKGARYRIDEYDGSERVMTPDDYEWEEAE